MGRATDYNPLLLTAIDISYICANCVHRETAAARIIKLARGYIAYYTCLAADSDIVSLPGK